MNAPNLGKTTTMPMFLEEAQPTPAGRHRAYWLCLTEEQSVKPSSSTPCLPPWRRRNMGLCQIMRLRRITHTVPPGDAGSSPSKVEGVARRAGGGDFYFSTFSTAHVCATRRRWPPCRSDNRASKMHKLTEPQVSAHECGKPGENDGNANVPRRGTTLLLASRRGGAAPCVLIVPLRGTIRETVIINPMFAAVAAPKHGALSNNASSTHHTHHTGLTHSSVATRHHCCATLALRAPVRSRALRGSQAKLAYP